MNQDLRILLVDDNPDDRTLVKLELGREFPGARVTEILDETGFAQALAGDLFDLAITDFLLGWTEGLTVLRRLKARRAEVPVIMFTGSGNEEVAVQAMKDGLDDYVIKKPSHFARLPAAVRSCLEKVSLRRARKEAEARYARLFENVPIALYRTTPDGRILDINPAVLEMVGYPDPESMKAVNVATFYANPEDRQRWKTLMNSRGVVKGFDLSLRRRDGAIIWVRNSAQAVRDEKGKLLFYEGSLEDITAQRDTELALCRQEEDFRLLVTNLPAIVFKGYEDGAVDVFADKIEAMTGYPKADFDARRRTWDDLIEETDRDDAREKFLQALKANRSYVREYRIRNKAGDLIWLQERSHIVCAPDGKIDYISGVIFDVTARKRNEDALRESFARLHRTLEGTVGALASTVEMRDPYTAGHQQRVAQLAGAVARELGLAEDRLEGLRVACFIHDIGKMAIPAEILSKPTRLNDMEFKLIKTHAQAGYDILQSIEFPWPVAQMVVQHHERLDGSGYPKGLTAAELLLEAKIMMVADVIEAMSSHRPYRPALGIDRALEEILQGKGVLYDPEVVEVCLALFREKGFKFSG